MRSLRRCVSLRRRETAGRGRRHQLRSPRGPPARRGELVGTRDGGAFSLDRPGDCMAVQGFDIVTISLEAVESVLAPVTVPVDVLSLPLRASP